MNIGNAAERSGLPAKTIRYYEDIGLVRPHRSANGYREFAPPGLGPVKRHKLAFLAAGRTRTASGTCFGPLTSRWPRSFAPSTPPGLSSPCSPTSQLL